MCFSSNLKCVSFLRITLTDFTKFYIINSVTFFNLPPLSHGSNGHKRTKTRFVKDKFFRSVTTHGVLSKKTERKSSDH